LGSFPAVWKSYIPQGYTTFFAQYHAATQIRYPDFGYLQLLCETGLVGLSAFVALLATISATAWRLHRKSRVDGDSFVHNLSAMILTLCVFVALSTMVQDTVLYVRVWIFLGCALLLDERILASSIPSAQQRSSGT
jgi:O-antigen ligase